jgi:hypothetical protein
MAKRFTDTEKWKDEWWGSLSNDYRMIWLYLVDSCSIAGIWKKDFRGLNFNCNTKITEKEFLEVFETRLIDRGNYFFIPKFLRFQCPKGLNSNKPAILSIIKELEQNNLILTVQQSLGNDFLIIKDKGKGTGQGKGEGKDTGTGQGVPENFIEVEEQIVTDPMPILEYYQAQLNGMQTENGNRAWRPLVPAWFNQSIGEAFNNGLHVKNSFKKFYLNQKFHGNGTNTNRKQSETLRTATFVAEAYSDILGQGANAGGGEAFTG